MLSVRLALKVLALVHVSQFKAIEHEENSTLKFVQVIFRHGERTNDPATVYPNDPYKNETYYPYGIGELTNEGKRTVYKLGKSLRERYNTFLGPTYTPDIVEATSSDTNRTKASLQLLLAGLFPPVGDEIWQDGLNWQPIPTTYRPRDHDPDFFGLFCPNFKIHLANALAMPGNKCTFEKQREIFDYVSKHSGWNITNNLKLYRIYLGLRSEEEFGLKLPEWAAAIYPQPLKDLAVESYGIFTSTTELKRLAVGNLLKRIVNNMQAKVLDEFVPKNRKIVLYSGHEFNIAFLLLALEAFNNDLPTYGSSIRFELHEMDKKYGVKIYYQEGPGANVVSLKLPACDEFCPVNQLATLLEEYLPTESDCGAQNARSGNFNF